MDTQKSIIKIKPRMIVISIVIFMILIAGLTYAYFEMQIKGSDKASTITSKTSDLFLNYNGVIATSGTIRSPGDSLTQVFSVTNTVKDTIGGYYIHFTDVINGFTRTEDLTYTLTCVASSGTCNGSSGILPTTDKLLVAGTSIAKGVTHTYTLTINYALLESIDQSVDMEKTFETIIMVSDSSSLKKGLNIYGGTIVGQDKTKGILIVEGSNYVIVPDNGFVMNNTYVDCENASYNLNGANFTTNQVGANPLCTVVLTRDFSYSGTSATFNPLINGKYKLEVWGAQGGGYNATYSTTGGKGGYSKGTINLLTSDTLYLYVGGKGGYINDPGGFNGGGKSLNYGGSGGGASDIRINTDSLYSRVIVAGGGGGGGYNSTAGGAGGGVNGIAGANGTSTGGGGGTLTSGGTAISGGLAGIFGSAQNRTAGAGGGGGGGFYGGGSGVSSSTDSGGGGGSGYVYTSENATYCPSGCLLTSKYYLTDASTTAGNISFLNPAGVNETGHAGNGYARVTFMGYE